MEDKKAIYQRVVDYSADLMDKHFPKGECKERGKALVFNAELITYVMEELDRAREEGYKKGRDKIDKSTPEEEVEESVWDMLEREEDGYIKEISNYWQKNGHKHIEIEIVPNEPDEPDEPEKVYVDPIVPNFTEELSWPVEYKTRKQVKEMFKDTPEVYRSKEDIERTDYTGYPYSKEFVSTTQDTPEQSEEWEDDIKILVEKIRDDLFANWSADITPLKDFIKNLLSEREREVFTKDELFMLKLVMNDIHNKGNGAYDEIGEKIERMLSKLNKKK